MRNRSKNQVELTLMRHGKTLSNEKHLYLGRTDEPLFEAGVRELKERTSSIGKREGKLLFSSPMQRCRQTAGILFPGQEPIIIPQWREMDFGAWEGKGYQDLQGDENYQRWIDSGGTLPFPEGESREAFGQRCLEGLRLCKNHMEVLLKDKANRAQTETICLGANAVVHGGTIMAVMSHLTGQDYFTFQVENGWGFTLCFDVTEEVPTEEMATGEVATGSFRWTLLSWEPTI